MRLKNGFFGCVCLLWGFLLFQRSATAETTLMSVKKGEQGNKVWAVYTFDQKALWVGVTQLDMNKLSLYFMGSAGEMDGSKIALDILADKEITIKQVSRNPSVFRSDITYDGTLPLAILKNNRQIVVAFNDERFLTGDVLKYPDDVSSTTGRLVNVSSNVVDAQVVTSLEFDGSYEWVGYIRPSRDAVALLIRGASLGILQKEFEFENGVLRNVRLFPDEKNVFGLKAVMFLQSSSPFSVVRKPQSLVFNTGFGSEQGQQVVEQSTVYPDVNVLKSKEESEVPARALSQPVVDNASEKKQPPSGRSDKGGEFKKPLYSNVPVSKSGDTFGQELEYAIPWDERVSFAFTSTPVKSALRTLARANGLNMVIDDTVDGTVTMDLKDVTLRQALDKIVHTHNCEYIVDEGIITVKPVGTIYKGGSVTRVYRLKYVDAVNVVSVIRQMVSNDSLVQVFYPEFLNFNEAGKNRKAKNEVAVQGIRRSSVLVVTDRPEKINEIDRVIRELDSRPVQIVIESKLVEMAPTKKDQIGINWDKTLTTVLQWQNILPNGDEQAYSMLNTSPDQGGKWQMGHLSTSDYKAVLDFLRENTDSKLISNPRLMAMDNEESSISVGTTVPIPKIQRGLGGQGDMVTFDYKEVNIQLNVTPHLGTDGEITMYVNPVIEEISGWVEYMQQRAPITDKRTVNSIVTVKDGETVVIGGLIKTQRVRTISKVWGLGSVPLLGRLFQHEKFEDKKTELMIFITPKIYNPEQSG
ncbi:MAG: secretin N-terminal domain-containing protein [bacterium]